jgi:hypothetical protein
MIAQTATHPRKETEKRALEAARSASPIIPVGEAQDFEKPDFKILTGDGLVGMEVTELLPPAGSDSFSSPLHEKSFHERAVQLAEREYNTRSGATPVKVTVYLWKIEDGRYDKRDMARALAEFVRTHRPQSSRVATFTRLDKLPDGFGTVSICTESGPWFCGTKSGITASQIPDLLAERIKAKNDLLPTYRSKLPGAPIWLLIFSCMEVARGVPIPHGLNKLTFPFDFDRVFFFSGLDNAVVELRKGELQTLQTPEIRL